MTADLDHAMRQILADMCTLSHGSTTSWNPGSGDGSGDGRPPGESYPPQQHWAWVYSKARDDDARQHVIDDARDELRRWRGQAERERPAGETLQQRNARIVEEGEGFSAREVAVRFRCAERDVVRARVDGGREPVLGREPPKPAGALERDAEIQRMAGEGATQRQIVLTLGVSKGTVDRALRRAAA